MPVHLAGHMVRNLTARHCKNTRARIQATRCGEVEIAALATLTRKDSLSVVIQQTRWAGPLYSADD